MKKLNAEEIKKFANVLSFTESEARDITDLFYNLKSENDFRVQMSLDNVDEYIREWENHWHREININECFEYEKENEYFEYDEDIAMNIFENIEVFKEYAMNNKATQFVYQLPNNDMIVVVC